jgi:hypothetical protein
VKYFNHIGTYNDYTINYKLGPRSRDCHTHLDYLKTNPYYWPKNTQAKPGNSKSEAFAVVQGKAALFSPGDGLEHAIQIETGT